MDLVRFAAVSFPFPGGEIEPASKQAGGRRSAPGEKREGDEREGGVGREKRNRLQFYRTLFAHKRGEKEQFDCLVARQSKSNIIFPCASTLYRLIRLQDMFLIISKIAPFPPVCRSFTSTEQILQLFREVRFLHQFDRA